MDIAILKVTSTEPTELVSQLVDEAVQKNVRVEKNSFQETLESLKTVTQPTAYFLDSLTEEAIKVFLKAVQQHGVQREVYVFVFLQNDKQTTAEHFLELGAADVFTNSTSPIAAAERINVIAPVLTTHFGTDIDITPDTAPPADSALRVFIVEDDTLLKNLLESKLASSNISCSFTTDFGNAIEEMAAFDPSVVILDIMLPEKNGLDVLAEMKQHDKLKQVPVIIFSNRDEQSDRNRATELGANGYYVKAMTDLSDLVKTIESLA